MARYTIGITGASGVIYGIRIIQELVKIGHYVDVVISNAGTRVLEDELSLVINGTTKERELQLLNYLNISGDLLTLHDIDNIAAPISSGSYVTQAMIIIPCTVGTLASIANGLSSNLIERAADVTIKEGRKLIISPRETPLNAIHLNNMLKLARLGVAIVPPMPAFYIKPKSINDIVDFIIGKILDQLDIEHNLYKRWS